MRARTYFSSIFFFVDTPGAQAGWHKVGGCLKVYEDRNGLVTEALRRNATRINPDWVFRRRNRSCLPSTGWLCHWRGTRLGGPRGNGTGAEQRGEERGRMGNDAVRIAKHASRLGARCASVCAHTQTHAHTRTDHPQHCTSLRHFRPNSPQRGI